MDSKWHINSIMLQHSQRFFTAAYLECSTQLVVSQDTNRLALALVGNVLWAKSPYVTENPQDEHNTAMLGALMSSLATPFLPEQTGWQTTVVGALGDIERQLQTHWDDILEHIWQQLQDEDLSYQATNQRVWECMFSEYEYPANQSSLQGQIRQKLHSLPKSSHA
ncbi:MAG TPA: hypothetical protein DCE42_24355 [Myxococcales bacterium]|nr:hypothetical protein [Deltaproteobacteria bacterium]HAA57919.1 hypothetical protein [Myxococcales bacterium]